MHALRAILRLALRCVLLSVLGAPAVVSLWLLTALLGPADGGHFGGTGTDLFRGYFLLAAIGAVVSAPAGVAGMLGLFIVNAVKLRPWSRRHWATCSGLTGGVLGLIASVVGPWPLGLESVTAEPELALLTTFTGLVVGVSAGLLNATDLESLHETHAS